MTGDVNHTGDHSPARGGHWDPSVPLATWGRGRAVRYDEDWYYRDVPIHLTICAHAGSPFTDAVLASEVCAAVENVAAALKQRLYAYCLMPDHLHVLISPADSGNPLAEFLRRMKSYTTRQYQLRTSQSRLWQYSARDRILFRYADTRPVAEYIAENPVRKGLVKDWHEWPYTKVLLVE